MEPDKDRDITELLGLDQTHAARHRARRLVTIAVGLVLVIGLGFWFFRDTGPALRYQSASVARGDLTVTVQHAGREVTLHDRTGGSTDNLTLRAAVEDFSGVDPAGAWALTVTDTASIDSGRLVSWAVVLDE